MSDALKLYSQKLEEEINKFSDKVNKCNLSFIIDDIIVINDFMRELKKVDDFGVIPEDVRKKYLEQKSRYEIYKEEFESNCVCKKRS